MWLHVVVQDWRSWNLRSGSHSRHCEGISMCPTHLCAVTYITEISLHVTLNNQSNQTMCPFKHWHVTTLLTVLPRNLKRWILAVDFFSPSILKCHFVKNFATEWVVHADVASKAGVAPQEHSACLSQEHIISPVLKVFININNGTLFQRYNESA